MLDSIRCLTRSVKGLMDQPELKIHKAGAWIYKCKYWNLGDAADESQNSELIAINTIGQPFKEAMRRF